MKGDVEGDRDCGQIPPLRNSVTRVHIASRRKRFQSVSVSDLVGTTHILQTALALDGCGLSGSRNEVARDLLPLVGSLEGIQSLFAHLILHPIKHYNS